MMSYHIPVMKKECLQGLAIVPGGSYADFTFGGGGHSKAILEQLNNNGKLYAFDRDEDARKQGLTIHNSSFTFIHADFRHAMRFLEAAGALPLDGIMADLGVSSHQFDTAERGFSIRFDGPLDMRMDHRNPLTAEQVLNTYSAEQLHKILGMYGEVRNAKTLAELIVKKRWNNPLKTINGLKDAIAEVIPFKERNSYLAQVFQAIRVEVNGELDALKQMLDDAPKMLKPGGKLVILSYHSLEDRMVKNYMYAGNAEGKLEKDLYGNEIRPMDPTPRKALQATEEEITANPRARSARLRVATKI